MPTPLIACVRTGGHDPAALFSACARLTPRVERHPDALVLDLGGCEPLVLGRTRSSMPSPAGWSTLAATLYRQVRSAMPGAEALPIGLGPTRTVAWLAAATAPGASWRAVEPGQVAAFLRPLLVGVLASLPDLRGASSMAGALETLAQSGIQTLGQLARLPALALRRRFGLLGGILATLATGQDAMPFRAWKPAAWIGARLRFAPPIEAAHLPPGALALLARHIARELETRHLGAGTVALALHQDDGTNWRAIRRLGQPVASAAALVDHAQRLLMRLAEREPGLTYSAVHLRVGDLRSVMPRQDALWLAQSERERRARRARLLAPDGPLAARHGGAAVLRATLVSPHAVLPEERYYLAPLLAA